MSHIESMSEVMVGHRIISHSHTLNEVAQLLLIHSEFLNQLKVPEHTENAFHQVLP
jgi:hypothetical protein